MISQREGQPPINKTVARATDILLCLGKGVNTVTEIANWCKYSTSTVQRLLDTLTALDWVIKDPIGDRYYLGPLVSRLSAEPLAAHKYLIMHSIQEMERLSQISEETVNLGIMVQLRCVMLYDIASRHDIRITQDSHRHRPPLGSAPGKVLLSQLDDGEIEEALQEVDLVQATQRSVADKNMLTSQLHEIRRQGYYASYGEVATGLACISAPISNYMYPAALSILGPEDRLKPMAMKLEEELTASADRISRNIAEKGF
ncbi:MAG: IclR family transcriptional regulator [Chloroflexota bacterium]